MQGLSVNKFLSSDESPIRSSGRGSVLEHVANKSGAECDAQLCTTTLGGGSVEADDGKVPRHLFQRRPVQPRCSRGTVSISVSACWTVRQISEGDQSAGWGWGGGVEGFLRKESRSAAYPFASQGWKQVFRRKEGEGHKKNDSDTRGAKGTCIQ